MNSHCCPNLDLRWVPRFFYRPMGVVLLQWLKLWVSRWSMAFRWTTASSENMILSRKVFNRETRFKINCAKDTLAILSVRFNACNMWKLRFLKPSFFRNFFTVYLLISSWFPILLGDCSGSWSTNCKTSSWSTVTGLIFYKVTANFPWKFLCHFLISLPCRVRLLRPHFLCTVFAFCGALIFGVPKNTVTFNTIGEHFSWNFVPSISTCVLQNQWLFTYDKCGTDTKANKNNKS